MNHWLFALLMLGGLMTADVAWSQPAPRSTQSDLDRFRQRADDFFHQGDYTRATTLYIYCTQQPGIAPETDKVLRSQISRVRTIERLRAEAASRIRANDIAGARRIYQQIVAQANNPTDPVAVAALRMPTPRPTVEPVVPTDVTRLNQKADQLIAQQRYSEANEVLRLVPAEQRGPAFIEKLRMTRALPTALAEINQLIRQGRIERAQQRVSLLVEQYGDQPAVQLIANRTRQYDAYQRERKRVEAAISVCRLEQAQANLHSLRREYPEFMAILNTRIEYVQRLQTTIDRINDWRTEPAKRPQVLQAYASIYRLNRACVLSDYFDYSLAIAREQMNNERYVDAIVSFERTTAISPVMAARNQVPILTDSCRRILTCRQRMSAYRQLVAQANLLYRRCEVDSAIQMQERASQIMKGCSASSYTTPADQETEQLWQKRRADAVQNKIQINRFGQLIHQADVLFEQQACAQARQLYQQADSIRVDCRQLNRSTVQIAACDACLVRQCYDSLLVQANRSQALGYYRDVLRYLQEARDCPAPADQLSSLQTQIDYWACRLDPTKCPPPPADTTAPVRLLRLSLIGGGTYLHPTLFESGTQLTAAGQVGWMAGGRLDYLTFKGWLDLRAEAQYSHYQFQTYWAGSTDIKGILLMDMIEFGVGLRV